MTGPESGIAVWIPSTTGRPWETTLAAGQSLTFGRGAPDAPVDLRLDHEGVSRLAGQVRGVEDHWCLSNFSRTTTYVVENPEGAGEFLKVPPRRLDLPVPFEFAGVLVVPGQPYGFQVTASRHQYAADDQLITGGSDLTTSAFALDRTARYFLVLVALCEPRLRDPSSTAMPTARQVVQRLAGLSQACDLTVDAVHAQVKYLATQKLRIRADGQPGRQRESLVAVALRFDVVREEDLALLPPAVRPGTKPA